MDILDFSKFNSKPIALLDTQISLDNYTLIDLSIANKELVSIAITNPEECQNYIDKILKQNNAHVAYGGYLEKRNIYTTSNRFAVDKIRNIHLGIDFWCKAGTKVVTPLLGRVHSFNNNSDMGNYGPTIILEHKLDAFKFYTLYGHLSLASLDDLFIGKEFKKGEQLATLGTTAINVNYAPHLHFQLIKNMRNFKGDYPGVCNSDDLEFYKENCPNPNLLLKL